MRYDIDDIIGGMHLYLSSISVGVVGLALQYHEQSGDVNQENAYQIIS
jgi:hypothetical protein